MRRISGLTPTAHQGRPTEFAVVLFAEPGVIMVEFIAKIFLPLFCAAGFLATSPIFRFQAVPNVAKATMSLGLATCFYLGQGQTFAHRPTPDSWAGLSLLAIGDSCSGAALGLMCTLIFIPLRVVASTITEGLGINLAGTVDPSQQEQRTQITDFLELLAMAMFFAGDFHLAMLRLLSGFMQWNSVNSDWYVQLGQMFATQFVAWHHLGLLLAAVLSTGFMLSTLAALLVARTSAALNFFVVGQGLRTALGLTILLAILPGLAHGVAVLWQHTLHLLEHLAAGTQ